MTFIFRNISFHLKTSKDNAFKYENRVNSQLFTTVMALTLAINRHFEVLGEIFPFRVLIDIKAQITALNILACQKGCLPFATPELIIDEKEFYA